MPEAQLQGFGSQRITPALSSALTAHVAAERASSVGSGEWGNFLFSFLVSPTGVPGLLPFPSVHRKTCQKDQAPGLKEFTKENWKQRPLIPSDYDQRLKPLCGNPEFLSPVPPLLGPLQGLLLFFLPLRFWANKVSHQHRCCLLSIPKFAQLELQPDSKMRQNPLSSLSSGFW